MCKMFLKWQRDTNILVSDENLQKPQKYPCGCLDHAENGILAQDLLVIKYRMKFTPNQSILISCQIYTSSLQNKLCNIYLYIPYLIYKRNTRHCILS